MSFYGKGNKVLVTNLNVLELMKNVYGNVEEMKDTVVNTDHNATQMSGKFMLCILFFNRTVW